MFRLKTVEGAVRVHDQLVQRVARGARGRGDAVDVVARHEVGAQVGRARHEHVEPAEVEPVSVGRPVEVGGAQRREHLADRVRQLLVDPRRGPG